MRIPGWLTSPWLLSIFIQFGDEKARGELFRRLALEGTLHLEQAGLEALLASLTPAEDGDGYFTSMWVISFTQAALSKPGITKVNSPAVSVNATMQSVQARACRKSTTVV